MKKNINLVSDFNLDIFYNFLSKKINNEKYKLNKPNFGLFHEKCFEMIKSKNKNHIIFVWTKIERVLKIFKSLIDNENVNIKVLYNEVDEYIDILKELAKRTDYLIVNSWPLPDHARGKYLNDYRSDLGLSKNINLINLKISEQFKNIKNIIYLNSDFLIKNNNYKYNPKLWYAAKIPFAQKVFEVAAEELVGIIDIFEGKSKKLIILDLDNTLWGGILGDLGWQKINIGGHSIEGEAFKEFQSKLKSLKNLGIQLALCSKNDEKKALEAIQKNPNMILEKKDFAAWKINWDDKAKNIQEILSELNLLGEAAVFIDDNIAERQRVKDSIEGIDVPNWPRDPCQYASTLQDLRYFNSQYSTQEDKNRTKYYQDESIRKKSKKKFISYDKWLMSLKIKIKFEKGSEKNKKRILQLVNKTNQMNLSTRRINDSQLDKLINDKNYNIFSCQVSDKFGDMGLVGVLSFKISKREIKIVDFILSCRVFGRSIEKSMLLKVIEILKKRKINKIVFKYIKTEKNKPCLLFLKKNLQREKENIFIYNKKTKISPVKFLKII